VRKLIRRRKKRKEKRRKKEREKNNFLFKLSKTDLGVKTNIVWKQF
jgi:hypothetical protein